MVIWKKIDISDKVLTDVLSYLDELSVHHPKKSTVGGWSSKNHIIVLLPFISEFLSEIISIMEQAAGHKLILKNYFFNANPTGAYHTPHAHEPATFSSVIYLKVPENSGELMWNQGSKMPEPGDIAFFPGDLLHWTGVNESSDTRVCLIMNFF